MPLSFILRIFSTMLSIFCNQIVDNCTTGDHHEFGFFKSNSAFDFTFAMANTALITSVSIQLADPFSKTGMNFKAMFF